MSNISPHEVVEEMGRGRDMGGAFWQRQNSGPAMRCMCGQQNLEVSTHGLSAELAFIVAIEVYLHLTLQLPC